MLAAVLEVWPSGRIGVRLSPNGVFNDMGSPDFRETYLYTIQQLAQLNLGYVHIMDVITSYSIHYTKLYDYGYAIHCCPFRGVIGLSCSFLIPFLLKGRAHDVITSYSIHYTKLYERAFFLVIGPQDGGGLFLSQYFGKSFDIHGASLSAPAVGGKTKFENDALALPVPGQGECTRWT